MKNFTILLFVLFFKFSYSQNNNLQGKWSFDDGETYFIVMKNNGFDFINSKKSEAYFYTKLDLNTYANFEWNWKITILQDNKLEFKSTISYHNYTLNKINNEIISNYTIVSKGTGETEQQYKKRIYQEFGNLDTNTDEIKYYFLPSNNKNKSIFNWVDPKKSNLRTIIGILNKGQDYELLRSYMFKDEPTSITTYSIQIGNSDIKMSKSVSGSMISPNPKQKIFNPPQIYIKMPISNQKSTWNYTGIYDYKCFSEFIAVFIDGKEKKAIQSNKTAL